MRASDVIQIMRLHLDAAKTFEVAEGPKDEDDWTEEGDEEFADLLKEVEAEKESVEGSDEESSEGSETEPE